MTEPLPTHESDRVLASTLGLPMGALTLPQLSADWEYHARTAPLPSILYMYLASITVS